MPASLDFGSVGVGSHLDKSFAIANNSGDTLRGGVGESCDHYEIVSGKGTFALAAGEIWPVTVRFLPESEGLLQCTIETGCDQCNDVSCSGTGETYPECLITPSSLDFGEVTGGHYKDMTFTIKNIGGGTVAGNVSESCDHYSIVNGGGPYSLGTGDSVVVIARFEPVSGGVSTCTIETGSALCGNVSCTGERTYPDPGMPDTIRIESLDVSLGTTTFDLRVYMHNDEELAAFGVPIAWSSFDLTCLDVDFTGSRVDYINTKIETIDNPARMANVGVIVFFESFIPPGTGLIFTLRFSIDPSAEQQVVIFDKTFYPPASYLNLGLTNGMSFVPQCVPGVITLE
jgi:hypothetical protein